jgi:hypothetical protein
MISLTLSTWTISSLILVQCKRSLQIPKLCNSGTEVLALGPALPLTPLPASALRGAVHKITADTYTHEMHALYLPSHIDSYT